MAAIKEGRRAIGEPSAVPAGSSCQVAPDGKVTVHAPMERQTYLLYPEGSAAAAQLPPLPGASASAAPAVPGPAAPSAATPPRRERPKTMAYIPETPIAPPEPQAPPARRPRPKTMAYIPPSELPQVPGPASREISVGAPTPADATPRPVHVAPAPAAPAAPPPKIAPAPRAATPAGGDAGFVLVASRDVAPTAESPLHYRERAFAIPSSATQSQAEAVARSALRALQAELAGTPDGQLLHVSVYDHTWSGQPTRPAIVALEWKDWRDELSVAYPLAEYASRMSAPAMTDAGSRGLDVRSRLAVVAEASEDLEFLESPEQALSFATRLLEELVEAPIIAGSLYDMAADALHICAERGTAGRLGSGLPRSRGLLGAAAEDLDAVLNVSDPRSDPRYDATIDGVLGLEPSCLMWVPLGHKGDLLGMLQLLHAGPGARFQADDATVALAVAQRVASFLQQMHMRGAGRRRA